MKKPPLADKALDEAKRIMGRLVNMPHKPHKDEPPKRKRRPALGRRKAK